MDFGGKRAAANYCQCLTVCSMLGGSVMGVGAGWLIESYGWGSWEPSMIGFSVIGAILMLKLWNARPGRGGH